MFANSHDEPLFQIEGGSLFRVEEPAKSRAATGMVAIRLAALAAIAVAMLVATAVLRRWTAGNDAKLPPIEFGKSQQRLSDPSWHHEERHWLTIPLHPQI
jgi:hypothetical protein